jgi:hypothetical protein
MNTGLCLFCNEPAQKADIDYICGSCVQLLLNADQTDLKQAHAKAIEKKYPDKARAIESFLIPEEKVNGQRKPISKKRGRHTDRKGIVRTVGDKEKRIGRSKVSTPSPVL